MTALDYEWHTVADEIAEASHLLSAFIEEAACRTAETVGFGYVLITDALDTYPALRAAFECSSQRVNYCQSPRRTVTTCTSRRSFSGSPSISDVSCEVASLPVSIMACSTNCGKEVESEFKRR